MYNLNKHDLLLLLKHDEDTYHKVYCELSNIICLYLIKNFHLSLEETKEIANDAFVQGAYLKIKQFDPNKSSFQTWIFTIAKNNCLNYLKKKKDLSFQDEGISINKIIDTNNINKGLLYELGFILNEVEFTYIEEHFIYDLSYHEIAKKYNVSLFYVKKIIKNAYDKIRNHKEILL